MEADLELLGYWLVVLVIIALFIEGVIDSTVSAWREHRQIKRQRVLRRLNYS